MPSSSKIVLIAGGGGGTAWVDSKPIFGQLDLHYIVMMGGAAGAVGGSAYISTLAYTNEQLGCWGGSSDRPPQLV